MVVVQEEFCWIIKPSPQNPSYTVPLIRPDSSILNCVIHANQHVAQKSRSAGMLTHWRVLEFTPVQVDPPQFAK